MTEMMQAQKRTIMITGAARGIGLAAASRFMADGNDVVAIDLEGADFSILKAQADQFGAALECVHGDVASKPDWEGALETARSRFGSVHVLFNNAGISGPTQSVTSVSENDFDRVMAVNVRGVFLGLQVIGAHMKEQGRGVIINTSSISGERGGGNVFAYTASKHAVNGMTKSAAISLAKHNVRVLAVCPCPTGTEMMYALERKLVPENPSSAREGLASGIPLKRYGEPQEIASVVAFLASDEASFMTGALVPVDGGTLAD